MNQSDQIILDHLIRLLSEGSAAWLITVLTTIGSAPRPVGSLISVGEDASQTGSISGGCVEEDLIARLLHGEFDKLGVHIVEYGVDARDNEKWGLPCGGRLQLAIQKLTVTDLSWLNEAQSAVNKRLIVERTVQIHSGVCKLTEVSSFRILSNSSSSISHCFGPRHRLLLVGAGHLSACLSSLALAMDYDVVLTDSRKWALDQWRGPAVEKIHGLPDDVVRLRGHDEQCAVITLSHDPRIDDMALMEALESNAWYVGALGSQRTTKERLKRLSKLGLNRESLMKLHAPVGLSIGSKTAMEIAVAIMAELTNLRRDLPEATPHFDKLHGTKIA